MSARPCGPSSPVAPRRCRARCSAPARTGAPLRRDCWRPPASSAGSSVRARSTGCGTAIYSTARRSPSSSSRGSGWSTSAAAPDCPGIPMAIARPDLRVGTGRADAAPQRVPAEAVAELGLAVEVVRGRAEEPSVRDRLGGQRRRRLAGGGLVGQADQVEHPVAAAGGRMLAIKGERAAEEVQEHRRVMAGVRRRRMSGW